MSIEKRFMKAEDWEEEKVTRVPHLNNVCIPSGYNRIDGICGNPLLPACIFEDKLYKTLNDLRIKYSDLFLKRLFVKMPYWNRKDSCIPDNYEFLDKEARLVSTAVTVVMIPKNKVCIKGTKLEYAYRKNDLLSLSERLKTEGQNFSSLVGNLGYYMTENLIEGILPWTHNTRYCEKFHLKTIKSYLGFYYYSKNEKINSTFMGAHKACVAINKNGNIEVIPKLCIEEYQVKLNDKCFTVKSINPKEIEDKVAVFTPAYRKDGDVEEYINGVLAWAEVQQLITPAKSQNITNIMAEVHNIINNSPDGFLPKNQDALVAIAFNLTSIISDKQVNPQAINSLINQIEIVCQDKSGFVPENLQSIENILVNLKGLLEPYMSDKQEGIYDNIVGIIAVVNDWNQVALSDHQDVVFNGMRLVVNLYDQINAGTISASQAEVVINDWLDDLGIVVYTELPQYTEQFNNFRTNVVTNIFNILIFLEGRDWI